MRTRGGVAAACLLVLLLAGCAGNESTSDASGRGNDAAAEAPADADEALPEAAGEPGVPVADPDRDVVTTGWVTMTVDDPPAAAQQLVALAESLGGYVSERTETAGDDDNDASAHVVMRVPAQDVTSTLERLRTVGTLEDFSLERTDVTLQLTDLDARIRAHELSVTRLEHLLEGATTTEELVQAEQVLTDRQAQLDSLRAQATALGDQVAMSTLEVSLWTPDAAPDDPPESFWEGIVRGWDSLLDALGAVLLAVGIALPWLAFLAVVVLLAVLLARALGRRRAERGGGPGGTRPGPTTALPPGPQPAWAGHTPGRPAPAAPPPAAPPVGPAPAAAPAGPAPVAAPAPSAPPAPPPPTQPAPTAPPVTQPVTPPASAEGTPTRRPPARRRTDTAGPSSTRPRGGKPGKPGTPGAPQE